MGLIGLSFFVMMTLFHLWDLPGDVLAAPESASGLDRCNLSLSLSLIPIDYVAIFYNLSNGYQASANIAA